MADVWEFLVGAQDTSAEPYCITLDHILIDTDFDWRRLRANHFLISRYTQVNALLNQLIQPFVEVVKQGTSA